MVLTNIILVAIGGAIGSASRYVFAEMIAVTINRGINFPLGIFLVNILGCLLAGFLHFILVHNFSVLSPNLRLLLMAGFLGGFTTFSAFSVDSLRLIQAGQIGVAASYIILSLSFSLLAVFFGFYLAKLFA